VEIGELQSLLFAGSMGSDANFHAVAVMPSSGEGILLHFTVPAVSKPTSFDTDFSDAIATDGVDIST